MKLKYFFIFLVVISTYFVINQFNYGREVYDLGFAFENSIPFLNWMVYFYLAYFFIILIPFFIMDNKKVAFYYSVPVIIADFFFIFLPTSIYRPLIENNNLSNYLINLIHSLDLQYNLFPSLHATLLTLSFILIFQYKKKLAYQLAPLMIFSLVSTLFIKQHHLADLIFGVLLALVSIKISKRFEEVI